MAAAFSLELKDYSVSHPHWWTLSVGIFDDFRQAREQAGRFLEKENIDRLVYRIRPITNTIYRSWLEANDSLACEAEMKFGRWI